MKRVFWIALIAVALLVLAAVGLVARGLRRTPSTHEPSARLRRPGRLGARAETPPRTAVAR